MGPKSVTGVPLREREEKIHKYTGKKDGDDAGRDWGMLPKAREEAKKDSPL